MMKIFTFSSEGYLYDLFNPLKPILLNILKVFAKYLKV